MDAERKINSYTWHQSHDQATVLLLVPYETLPEDIVVIIEQTFLVAGVRGQPPIIKGQLYGHVDTASSVWQLEPRASARVRTTSTTSTVSTQSSYAYVSDPETSSSFGASLESGHVSENEDLMMNSPGFSQPPSRDEQFGFGFDTAHHRIVLPHPASPGAMFSHLSSFSSVDSLHWTSGRLLTLHIEKSEPIIWPSLVIGPVPEAISPPSPIAGPSSVFLGNLDQERDYNMDPTSLGLMAEDLYDIRNDQKAAFECFVRAWRQAHTPLATLRLVTHYLPITLAIPPPDSSLSSPNPASYYFECVGGNEGLAQLYLDAGLLYLEGAATTLMSSSSTALSSMRMGDSQLGGGGTAAWRRDREFARRYFDRARTLYPRLDVPLLSLEGEDLGARRQSSSSRESSTEQQLLMPSIDIHASNKANETPAVDPIRPSQKVELESTLRPRKRRKDDTAGEDSMIQQARANDTGLDDDDDDNSWYLYLPGIIGAGTALLVVGVVSALSFSSWRKQQG